MVVLSCYTAESLINVIFTAQVKMPSGQIDLPVIEDNFDGTVRVQYNPKEDGVHELILLHNGAPVTGELNFSSNHFFKYWDNNKYFDFP